MTEFAEYAREQAEALAPKADWTEPELPRRATAELIAAWLKDHPNNYAALRALGAAARSTEKKWDEAAKSRSRSCASCIPTTTSAAARMACWPQVHRELGKNHSRSGRCSRSWPNLSADDVEMLRAADRT